MQPQVIAQWAADPTKRHELRYWDGAQWTDWVADRGQTTQDPLYPAAPQPEATPPVAAAVEPAPAGSVCAECGQAYEPTDAWVCQGTPGLHPPVGQGQWPDTAYCPHCGALVADAATGDWPADIPIGLLYSARHVPLWVKPMHEEGRLDLAALRDYQEMLDREEIPTRETPAGDRTPDWHSPDEAVRLAREAMAGDPLNVEAKLEQAKAAGLTRPMQAEVLGVAGVQMIGPPTTAADLERIEAGIRLCVRSVALWKTSFWQAHYVIGRLRGLTGDEAGARAAMADAHRYAATKWWDPAFLRELDNNLDSYVTWAPRERLDEALGLRPAGKPKVRRPAAARAGSSAKPRAR